MAHCVYCFCAGISDEWDQVSRQDHPLLQQFPSLLPSVIMHEHALSLVKKYSQAFDRFHVWCRGVGVSSLPASSDYTALHMVELLLSAETSA